MKKLGENPTEDDLLTLVNKFDEDGNGTIEFSEFLVMMITKVAREDDISQEFITLLTAGKGSRGWRIREFRSLLL